MARRSKERKEKVKNGEERKGEGRKEGNRIVERKLFNHQAYNIITSSNIETGRKIETVVYSSIP